MSARWRYIALLTSAFALFAALAAIFDRELIKPSRAAPHQVWREASQAQRAEVLAAISLFNKIYQDFYATGGDPRLIDTMPATKEVKHQIFRDLGYLGDAGRILVMDEAQAMPLRVESDGAKTARATVYEEWNYQYQEAGTRKPVTRIKGMGQGFLYTLKLEPQGVQVAGWEFVAMERPKPTEGFVW